MCVCVVVCGFAERVHSGGVECDRVCRYDENIYVEEFCLRFVCGCNQCSVGPLPPLFLFDNVYMFNYTIHIYIYMLYERSERDCCLPIQNILTFLHIHTHTHAHTLTHKSAKDTARAKAPLRRDFLVAIIIVVYDECTLCCVRVSFYFSIATLHAWYFNIS